jgi:hypothetical protein
VYGGQTSPLGSFGFGMSASHPFRTLEDLERAVRAVAREFKTNKVFIIGSQSILLAWPNAPTLMRSSPEIDMYPENAKTWEAQQEDKHPNETSEASEHINALFGSGSQFHQTFGFYIDGVVEHTAKLPHGWQTRAVVRHIDVDERTVVAVAPSPEDVIISKLARLEDKDKEFIEAYHLERPLNPKVIEERIGLSDFHPAIAARAFDYIRKLTQKQK